MIYFTADTHFGHANIIKYESRPFADTIEMDKEMVRRWNKVVQPKDETYIIGDFLFGDGGYANFILEKLNGRKYLIVGNHDSFLRDPLFDVDNFVWVKEYYRLNYQKQKIALFHYPMVSWDCSFHGSIHLFGHVHSHPMPYQAPNSYNVGVDLHDFAPVPISKYV